MSTFTFAATINAIRYVGAEPHFADCDEETGNITPRSSAEAVQGARGWREERPGRRVVDMLV